MEGQLILALAGSGIVGIIGYMLLSSDGGSAKSARVNSFTGKKSFSDNFRVKGKQDEQGNRRKQIEETLKKLEETQKSKKKAQKSIQAKLLQADSSMSRSTFMTVSMSIALIVGLIMTVLGLPIHLTAGAAFIAGFGLPRFVLNFKIKRRQKKFIMHFADGMDIIVRGVRTGLPLGDCLKIIAHESPDPLGAEFRRVVEAEALGVPIEVCLEQMYERMPTPEVNFFATVLNIQKTTGGNLGESLANLSNVLRSRKILVEKIKSLSAEAKMSAMIIGALPIVVMGLISIMSPEYMAELFTTDRGQQNLMIGGVMMAMGIFIMRKMIDFKY